jgi:hypothetical protein
MDIVQKLVPSWISETLTTNRIWLLVAILLFLGIFIIFYLPDAKKPKQTRHNGNKTKTLNHDVDNDDEEESKFESEPQKVHNQPVESAESLITADFYPQLECCSSQEIQAKLVSKLQEVRQKVPHFPEYPNEPMEIPTDKGNYASLGERCMIEFLEKLFPGYKFIKDRPSWLRNDRTNYPLEIDGYNKDLNLGAEYNGIQHYVWPNWTGQSYDKFEEQVYRDSIKPKTFRERGECLIVISYLVPIQNIPLATYCRLLESVPGISPYI